MKTGLNACRSRFGFSRAGGFTLVETMFAAGILAVFVCSSLAAFNQINRLAAVARLRVLALAYTQQRIDFIMTTPWGVLTTRPAVLAVGTQTENSLPLDNDSFNNGTGLSSAFTNLDVQVAATRTTVITDVSARVLRAVVTVSYTYRGKTYTVTQSTERATDSI